MNITTETTDTCLILTLPAMELDSSQTEVLREQITPMLEESPQAILNMEAIDFIDSSGLGSIVACQRICKGKGGQLVLCSLNNTVRDIFTLVRMDRFFAICDTLDEAKAVFQS